MCSILISFQEYNTQLVSQEGSTVAGTTLLNKPFITGKEEERAEYKNSLICTHTTTHVTNTQTHLFLRLVEVFDDVVDRFSYSFLDLS